MTADGLKADCVFGAIVASSTGRHVTTMTATVLIAILVDGYRQYHYCQEPFEIYVTTMMML
jgi:hypothetical protein